MEMSHRSSDYEAVLTSARQGLHSALGLSDDHEVLFLQGGATMQFSMVPMNLLHGGSADYITTGAWGKKALAEAAKFGSVNEIFSSADTGFRSIPANDELRFSADAAYVHYTSNETIDGVEFPYDLDAGGVPVVCDASSNILSRPFDVSKYALIYGGAQRTSGQAASPLLSFARTCSKIFRTAYLRFLITGRMPMRIRCRTPLTHGASI